MSDENRTQTNLRQIVAARLQSHRDFKLSTNCAQVKVGTRCSGPPPGRENSAADNCTDVYEQRCSTVVGKLSLGGPLLHHSDVDAVVSEPNWKAIPYSFLGWRETYTNCTSEKQSTTFTHTVKETVGHRATKIHTLETESGINASVSYNYVPGTTSNATVAASFRQKVVVTDQREDSFGEERTFAQNFPLIVPAGRQIVMEHVWIRRELQVPFSGNVVVDAPIAPNMEGVNRLSQLFPSEADRRFQFSGFITDSDVRTGETLLRESKPACGDSREWRVSREPFYK